MRFLLDTHIFLWWIKGDRKLPEGIRSRILQASEVYISSASIWEMAIKIKLTPCATFFSVRVRARDRARARTETPSFGKKSVQDFDGSSK